MSTLFQLREVSQLINTVPIHPGLQHLLSTWLLRHPSRVNDRTRVLHQMRQRAVPSMIAAWKEQRIDYYSSIIVKLDGVEHFAVTEEIICIHGIENFLMV